MTLLEPKIEKSPTCCKFENFDPDPQLDIKFWNPYECWWQFFIIYIYIHIYMFYIPTKYEENWRTLLSTVRPIPPIPSNWSKIKTPPPKLKKTQILCLLPPPHKNELLRLNSQKNKRKRWLDIKFKILFKILCKKWHFWNLNQILKPPKKKERNLCPPPPQKMN